MFHLRFDVLNERSTTVLFSYYLEGSPHAHIPMNDQTVVALKQRKVYLSE